MINTKKPGFYDQFDVSQSSHLESGMVVSKKTRGILRALPSVVVSWLLCGAASAQMILVESPLDTVSSSFYENIGTGFSFSIPGSGNFVGLGPDGQPTQNGAINFDFGGLSATPPFGGYDPAADGRFGFGYRGRNGGGFNLNFSLGQGANQSYTSTRPFVVLTNGFPGSVSDQSLRPFVTSIVPVIGNGAEIAPDDGLTRHPRRQASGNEQPSSYAPSTAATADVSVAAIRRERKNAARQRIEQLIQSAQDAAADGKMAVARNHLRNALRRAQAAKQTQLYSEIQAELDTLR